MAESPAPRNRLDTLETSQPLPEKRKIVQNAVALAEARGVEV